MKKIIFFALIFTTLLVSAQLVTTQPEFPSGEEEITIVFDATEASDSRADGLLGLSSGVYLWSGAGSTENGDAFEFEPSGQTNFQAPYEPGVMTSLGNDRWEIKLTPRTYYGVPKGTQIVKMGLVFKNADGSAQTEDIIIELFEADQFSISLNSPSQTSLLVDQNDVININASSSDPATFTLTADGNTIDTQSNTTSFNFDFTVTESFGTVSIALNADDGLGNSDQINFSYTLRTATVNESRPSGIIRGINYDESDETRVTLCLQTPNKSSVYAIGDFSNWELDANYQMKKDGEFFWVEITGLTPEQEYAFQYLVDETIYIADPYADKILHPDDRFISDEIYPNLKEFPAEAQNTVGFYNTVSVFETGQTPYEWTVQNFEKPEASDLIIYELLVRDFFANGEENYKNLIDTLSYIKSLGVNAIELMPITEFSGNDSWGYNPTFMFAPDKAYGQKNDLKAFIDKAHELEMAVILDMVLNQQEQPSPLVLLDFNLTTSQVTTDNPYFNIQATHPFNVFYDMNHESEYTQSFVDTVNHYWIHEYQFDGYRFDLSKGFTQTNYGDNVGAWSSYDAGRIALLKRMADEIWSNTPDAYVILEHFANNDEEKELADYGMMLWGNMHGAYKQNILGFETDSDISGIYHSNRDWNEPHLIGYMESHDEERQMYDVLQFGNSISGYSTKDENNAIDRIQSAFAMLLTIPGPKMYWQFGELAYDVSIDENGRTGQKPTPWDESEGDNLYSPTNRRQLRQFVSEITKLRTSHDLFSKGNATIPSTTSLIKQFSVTTNLSVSNPTSPDEMSAVLVANFDLEENEVTTQFPFDGTWFNYFDDTSIEVSGNSSLIVLDPGDFRIFTNSELVAPELILSAGSFTDLGTTVYPNPASSYIKISSEDELVYYFIYKPSGGLAIKGKFKRNDHSIDLNALNEGLYVIETISRSGDRKFHRFIKE